MMLKGSCLRGCGVEAAHAGVAKGSQDLECMVIRSGVIQLEFGF